MRQLSEFHLQSLPDVDKLPKILELCLFSRLCIHHTMVALYGEYITC